MLLLTTHRRENHGEPMRRICEAVLILLQRFPRLQVICPLHLSSRVRQVVCPMLGSHPRVWLVEPLGYEPFVLAMRSAHIILSDSGGVQEEAPASASRFSFSAIRQSARKLSMLVRLAWSARRSTRSFQLANNCLRTRTHIARWHRPGTRSAMVTRPNAFSMCLPNLLSAWSAGKGPMRHGQSRACRSESRLPTEPQVSAGSSATTAQERGPRTRLQVTFWPNDHRADAT